MLNALSIHSLSFRLSRYAYIVSNKQHQLKIEGLHNLRKNILQLQRYNTLCKTPTVLDSVTRFSKNTMSSTTSSINLQALGNKFVKMVPTMEVKLIITISSMKII